MNKTAYFNFYSEEILNIVNKIELRLGSDFSKETCIAIAIYKRQLMEDINDLDEVLFGLSRYIDTSEDEDIDEEIDELLIQEYERGKAKLDEYKEEFRKI
jgi:hypothetical protein